VNEQQATEQTAQPPNPPELNPRDRALLGALAAGRAQHEDFDVMLPIMDTVVSFLYPGGAYPDWKDISAAEFIECLYSIARYANFTAEARRVVFAHAQPNQPQGVM
jgi:hypothetical protein